MPLITAATWHKHGCKGSSKEKTLSKGVEGQVVGHTGEGCFASVCVVL